MKQQLASPPSEAAVRDFVDAVHALSDNPGKTSVKRYLAASKALDDSRASADDPLERAA